MNFFLEESSIGKSRAEQTCLFLKELNPDVEGHFIAEVRQISNLHFKHSFAEPGHFGRNLKSSFLPYCFRDG